ncbi:trace amine-associated receptor 1-like [Syngnathoides biaculeatus]|uniref:trace amine-associated receptor 1-like n=1 Tax=Syngnathoides biaculeatus TaxID=300417 RepID=UPI002ADE6864|nr:trace amine-associated receptor 1-like [Syngnathoides biaculeatus]
MESEDQSELCFPQLGNLSCKKSSFGSSVLSVVLLLVVYVLTVLLNLVVIISISHFRHISFIPSSQLHFTRLCFVTLLLLFMFSFVRFFFFLGPSENLSSVSCFFFLSLSTCRQLHTPTNLLLLSLAVSDLLVGLLLILQQTYNPSSCWLSGDIPCSLYQFAYLVVTSASIGNMTLISADRYVAICDPLHYNVKVTVKRIQLCVCLCWLLSLLYCCIVFNDLLIHPGKYNSCYGECVVTVDYNAAFVDVVVTFILPLSIIVTLYMRVFVVAVSQARAMRSHVACGKLRHSAPFRAKKSEVKAARTLGILVVVSLMCFCPYYIVSLAGNQFRVYPATCPMTAGIGSSAPRDPCKDNQLRKWMDGWMDEELLW